MANVNYIRKELQRFLSLYTKINDCIQGEDVIKSKRTDYLPMPNSTDTSIENLDRYNQYLQRAVFYNVTAKTLNGLTGQIFEKKINSNIPESLKNIKCSIDNYNISLDEFAKKVTKETISFGRCGILIDFPKVDGVITKSNESNYNPILKFYSSADIINWFTISENGQQKLKMVILTEKFQQIKDGFDIYEGNRWKVLTLENNEYWISTYESVPELINDITNSVNPFVTENFQDRITIFNDQTLISKYKVLDYNGNPINEIMFEFVGAMNNDPCPDNPPLGDLAILNIGHYRNSADYEDAVYLCGQPIPTVSGLTQQWVEEVLKDGVKIGSRAYVPLPQGGKFDLVQAQPNTLPFEAMGHKEKQMSALGAKLIEQGNVAKTAFEKSIESGSEVSILASIANNVSIAIENSLKKASIFMSSIVENIIYKLNDDFEILKMTSSDRQQLMLEFQAGLITWEEYRTGLRNAGVAYQDDELAKQEYDKRKEEVQMQNDKELQMKQKNDTISNQNNMQ